MAVPSRALRFEASRGDRAGFPRALVAGRRLAVPGRRASLAVLAAVALFALLTVQVAAGGVVTELDWAIFLYHFERRYPQWDPAMEQAVVLGQRALALPVVLAVAAWLARAARTWRPVLLVLGSAVALSGVVGVLKLAIGRAKGETGSGEAFSGGLMYPSGHSANTVLLWGLLGYLLLRYGRTGRTGLVVVLAAVPSVVVAVASTFIRSHWVSDIVAGWLVGAVVLILVVELDRQLRPPPGRPPGGGAGPRATSGGSAGPPAGRAR